MSPSSLLRIAGLVGAIAVAASPALAQGSAASSAPELARVAETLKPGQWVWAPQIAPAGPLLVYVDLSRQRATVYRNGVRIAVSTISSGKPGYETPTGVFTILQKDADHKSNLYNAAPMPFQQRLTWDGVALHAGGLPGYPESHGCVHLPYSFAKALFAITKLGATVVVQDGKADHVRSTAAGLLQPILPTGKPIAEVRLEEGEYRWAPEKAAAGPVTIIVSKHDQAIVVLRNGTEIGRSRAIIKDDDPGSHVISLTTAADGKPRWIYVGLPGHAEDAGRPLDEATLNRVRMPRAFLDSVKAVLVPGSTILVTQSSVGEDTGRKITIMDAVPPKL
ncbi:L,D-transpeptidase [Sphingomonas sp. BIUV-7]|uniref:L,D-transpeptidase n=1 Tax=Sphingomonas natans TaxID=3063330 RepID=A0ABT8YDU2_9SPHN|nr:L,D-transpeptidase [Sphingomonas sp. BIUV-7]MDO6416514.1 L,D-transpeptidase [Sphingomonas sp. BIUV-7]